MRLLSTLLLLVGLLAWAPLQAQTLVKGQLLDKNTKESIIGANILIKGTTIGTVSDYEGYFILKTVKTGSASITITSVGYESIEKSVTLGGGTVDLGVMEMSSGEIGLKEVEVVASVAIDRKTPVAVSTVGPQVLQEKLGNQEFPEVLKSTPGVFATRQGGGWGDSRINLRGFSSANVAVLINGIPINDMENGAVYWSNWQGLSDVTRSMQVQRGLGASRLAVPSVGGTINILTNTTDVKPGGNMMISAGNNGYFKTGITVSTGMEKGWAFTFSGTRTVGDGWVDNTSFEGWSYFANLSKQINNNHMLAFNVFGASQTHDQRRTQLTQEQWDRYTPFRGIKYNPDWGYSNGTAKAARLNFYKKPQLSLAHYWTISPTTELNTTVYASFGRGGGTRPGGSKANNWFDVNNQDFRSAEGQINFDRIYAENRALAAQGNGTDAALVSDINDHNWYGLISTVTHRFLEDFTFAGGIDLRYYKGFHFQRLDDLLGGAYFLNNNDKNNPGARAQVGDKVGFNNLGWVQWQSLNGQVEYSKGPWSAFVTASVSRQAYRREDLFRYTPAEGQRTDWVNFWGVMVKGGANYNINQMFNVFVNSGYFTRQPFFNTAFVNNTNIINDNAKNERIFSIEGGVGLRSKTFVANANFYYTQWADRSFVYRQPGVDFFANVEGIDAVHYGVEFDCEWKPIKKLSITGMASYGDWKWKNNVNNVQILDADSNPVGEPLDLYLKGVHVGDAAQFTAALGVNYEPIPRLKFGGDINFFDKLYANFDIFKRTQAPAAGESNPDSWRLPSYNFFDLFATYSVPYKQMRFSVTGKVNNLGNTTFISDATDGVDHNLDTSRFFYGVGRNWTVTAKVAF